MSSLYLIDASGFIYRSYFAIRNMTNPQGQSTNALFGFIRSCQKLFKDFSPDQVVCVFDGPQNAKKRKEIYEHYKAHRSEMPADLRYQIEWARHWCDLSGLPSLSVPEVEADDTMATMAVWGTEQGIKTYLCTSDKDLCQMVSDQVNILNTFKENLILNPEEVEKIYGVKPSQIVDYLSITGDTSDNIPGLAGIGPKGASKLLQDWGDLEGIFANVDNISSKRTQEIIKTKGADALLSRRLVQADLSVPFPKDLNFIKPRPAKREELKEFYKEMNFTTLLKELELSAPSADSAENFEEASESPTTTYKLVNDEPSFKALIKLLENSTSIAFNTETTSEQPLRADLVGISFCVKETEAFYVPFNGGLSPSKILGALKPLFENKEKAFLGHNSKYDIHVLRNYGIELKNLSFDTMLAAYLLNAHERRHHLEHLIFAYFDKIKVPLDELIGKGKKQISLTEVPLDKLMIYSCEDVDYTFRLAERFKKELCDRQLDKVYYTIELPLVAVLAAMERNGIYVDTKHLKNLAERVNQELSVLTETLYEMAGETFNLNSPKQLSQILFEKMGITPPKKTDTGFSTGAEVLEQLKWTYPIAEKLLDYRSLEKLRSTYIEKLPLDIHPRDGRIHCTFNQAVAATGRLSCQDPNLQNIPIRSELGREIREAFKPEKAGWSFFSADYSQIELRLLAHLSEDSALIDAFTNNQDIHTRTASDVMGVPLDQVTKEMRQSAKAVNFGILYGQGEFGLSQELGISRAEAGKFIARYFDRYPSVKNFIQKYKDEALRTGKTLTLTGRERLIPEINNKNRQIKMAAERLAVNTPLQGTAADLIKLAMLAIDAKLKQVQARGQMILQIHDELIFEIPDEEIPLFQSIVPKYMESVFSLKVPLVVDSQVGKNWKEC